ncbi:7474_t:CDS:2, partial [Scutellospora calospora]
GYRLQKRRRLKGDESFEYESNFVLSDRSIVVEKLEPIQKSYFLEPRNNMKCDLLESIASRCKKFVNDFNKSGNTRFLRNVVHNKSWKENVSKLGKRAERILSVL